MLKLQIFTIIVVVAILLPTMEASQAISAVSTHPDYPGKCYDETTKTAYAVGDKFTKSCSEYRCSKDFRFKISGCPPPGVISGKDCKEDEPNLDAQYPDCCKDHVCE